MSVSSSSEEECGSVDCDSVEDPELDKEAETEVVQAEEGDFSGMISPMQTVAASIESTSSKPSAESVPLTTERLVTFMGLGLGVGWVVVDAMFVAVPFLEWRLPERLRLASHMTVAGVMPLATVLPFYYLITSTVGRCNYSHLTLAIVLCQSALILSLIAAWPLTIDGTSVVAMTAMFLASACGHLQTSAIIPWLATVDSRLISLLLTGSNIGSLSAALLGLFQQPGADEPNFGARAFFACFLVHCFIGASCYRLVSAGLSSNQAMAHKSIANANRSMTEYRGMSAWQRLRAVVRLPSYAFDSEVMELNFIYASMQFVTWIFVRSTLPFAAVHSTRRHSEANSRPLLAFSIEMSLLALTMGSTLASIKPVFYFRPIFAVFCTLTLIFVVIVFDSKKASFDYSKLDGSQPFLVFVVFMLRFLEGYTSPLIFRRIAIRFNEKCEPITRFISMCEKMTTFVGVWISFGLIQSGIIRK